MTIDPLKIPCPHCGTNPIIPVESRTWIMCRECENAVPPKEWITGGINALAGKLMREEFYFSSISSPKGKSWCWDNEGSISDDIAEIGGGPFDTFEEAVFDAWEYLERKKHDH